MSVDCSGIPYARFGPVSSQPLVFETLIPASEPVNGAQLLEDLTAFIRRFCVLTPEACTAAALWVLHTYNIDCFTHSPYLAIQSPEKGCGKTVLLSVLQLLVYRPLAASNISPAAIFRVIEAQRPTLLIDEIDSIFGKEGQREEFRGILNAGHSRGTAFVLRVVGENHEPRKFSTWAAKAIAGIGTLPGDTYPKIDNAISLNLL